MQAYSVLWNLILYEHLIKMNSFCIS